MRAENSKLKPTVYITTVPELHDVQRQRALPQTAASRHSSRGGRHARRRGAATQRRRRSDGWRLGTALLVLFAATGCGPKVMVPPRLDLARYYEVGLVTFTMENGRGSLNQVATERFAAEVFAGQLGVGILELGEADRVLQQIGEVELDARAAQAIGDVYGVPAVFVGHLKISSVKPRAAIVAFPRIEIPRVEATVGVEITVRLLSTESGATLWSNTGSATETVGELGLVDGEVYFGAQDPNEAYGRLVDILIYDLTGDLRPTYVRQ